MAIDAFCRLPPYFQMVSAVHTTAGAVREADARACRRDAIQGRDVQKGGDAQHHMHRWHRTLICGNLVDHLYNGVSRVVHEQPFTLYMARLGRETLALFDAMMEFARPTL